LSHRRPRAESSIRIGGDLGERAGTASDGREALDRVRERFGYDAILGSVRK
jgi:hypothetical protein